MRTNKSMAPRPLPMETSQKMKVLKGKMAPMMSKDTMPSAHKKRMMELSSPGKAANVAKGYINSKKIK